MDIDCGGLDSISAAYGLPLTENIRYRYTGLHQIVFDTSFILFTPPVVLLFVWLGRNINLSFTDNGNSDFRCKRFVSVGFCSMFWSWWHPSFSFFDLRESGVVTEEFIVVGVLLEIPARRG